MHLPDILVDCFTLNDQSIDGAAAIARNVEQRYHYRNIQVLPVPMRIDEAEKDKADVGLATARSRFGGSCPTGLGEYEANDYWAAVAIPYKPFYAFEETLAVFGDAPRSPLSLLGAYERLTAAITDGRGPRARRDERGDPAHVQGARSSGRGSRRPATSTSATCPRTGCGRTGSPPCSRRAASTVLRPSSAANAGGSTREDAERGAAAASRTIAIAVRRLPAVAAGPGRLGRDGRPRTRRAPAGG